MSAAVLQQRSALRGRLENAIERALHALDQIDGDADYEAANDNDEDGGDDEPSLCGIKFGRGDWDGSDLEPNLTPAQSAALEELFHQSDLIGRLPLACEIDWTLDRLRRSGS